MAGGIITGYVAYQGYGIVAVAGVQIFTGLFSLIAYSVIAWRHIQWLGLKLPSRKVFLSTANRSVWFSLWGFINAWILMGDVIMLGALVEAALVSKYVLTLYASQMISMVILTVISAVLPGLGGLIGNNEFERAEKVRKESMLYSWCLSVSICATVIVMNPSFVTLWVGDVQFAGNDVNAMLAIAVFQLVFINLDASMLNLALDIKRKVLLGMVSVLVTLALMLILVPEYNLLGMCFALIIGRSILTFSYPKIIADFFQATESKVLQSRHYLATIGIFFVAYLLSKEIQVNSWGILILSAAAMMLTILLVNYYVVLTRDQKHVISARIKAVMSIRKAL
jgi:O-antigen/teichoic acid export membrane protein